MDGSLLSEDDSDIEGQLTATNNQLFKIEKKIQQGTDLSKRERRLLQNRKSALKCRLKKQHELDKMKKQVDKLANENRELKEKVSGRLFKNCLRLAPFPPYFSARSRRIAR